MKTNGRFHRLSSPASIVAVNAVKKTNQKGLMFPRLAALLCLVLATSANAQPGGSKPIGITLVEQSPCCVKRVMIGENFRIFFKFRYQGTGWAMHETRKVAGNGRLKLISGPTAGTREAVQPGHVGPIQEVSWEFEATGPGEVKQEFFGYYAKSRDDLDKLRESNRGRPLGEWSIDIVQP